MPIRKYITVAFSFWVVFVAPSTYSDSSLPGGVAFFDQSKLWTSLPEHQSLRADLESALEKMHKKYSALEKSLKKESDGLMKEKQLLQEKKRAQPDEGKTKDFENRWMIFKDKLMKIQKEAEEERKKIGDAFEEAMANLKKTVLQIIRRLAQERQFKTVLLKELTVYADDSLDLTDDILDALKNETLPAHLDIPCDS